MKKLFLFLMVSLLTACSSLPLPSLDLSSSPTFFSSGNEVRLINEKDESIALRYFLDPPSGNIHTYYLNLLGIPDSFITTKFEAQRTYPNYFWVESDYTFGQYTATAQKNGNNYDFFFKGIEKARHRADQMVMPQQEIDQFKAAFKGKFVILVSVDENAHYACKRQKTYDDKAYCIALDKAGASNQGKEYNYLTTYYDLEKNNYQKQTKIHNNKIPQARCYEWADDFFHCKKLRKAKLLVGMPKSSGPTF